MSAIALRYVPKPGKNGPLGDAILELAHRRGCFGASMIDLKLRQDGWEVDHKSVENLYTEMEIPVRSRRR